MAHSIVRKTLVPGSFWTIYHFGFVSDGASGELSDYVLVDPVADLGLKADARLVVQWIEYNFVGFDGRLEFDSGLVDDNLVWVLNRDISSHNFDSYGGLKDPSGLDGTGKIQFSTVDFANANAQGSIILKIRNG